jgi:hypothetical protein
MAGGKKSKTWGSRAQAEHAATSERIRAERARALLGAQQARLQAATPKSLARPGVSVPTFLRYATTTEPQKWLTIDAGQLVINTILQCAEDGYDRITFPWPNHVGGGFVGAAIALHEARSRGRLAHATVGYWPWRTGATWPARSILVNPADLLANAQRICNEVRNDAAWADTRLCHEDRAVVELRLRELLKEVQTEQQNGNAVIVRSPNLLEVTPTFPSNLPTPSLYEPQPNHFLYRVRRHTHIVQVTAASRLTSVNDPDRTPFALFGLPATIRKEELQSYLASTRFARLGLDVIVVDLTQVVRQAFPDTWERALTALVSSLV